MRGLVLLIVTALFGMGWLGATPMYSSANEPDNSLELTLPSPGSSHDGNPVYAVGDYTWLDANRDVNASEGIDPTWDAGVVLIPVPGDNTDPELTPEPEPVTPEPERPRPGLPQTGVSES